VLRLRGKAFKVYDEAGAEDKLIGALSGLEEGESGERGAESVQPLHHRGGLVGGSGVGAGVVPGALADRTGV
jgi:hypothetical protein